MGRYKTRDTDERGEIIQVPEIPDAVIAGQWARFCNFCIYQEDRVTGEQNTGQCILIPDGCQLNSIYIYRHELKEYKARAIVAKINGGGAC